MTDEEFARWVNSIGLEDAIFHVREALKNERRHSNNLHRQITSIRAVVNIETDADTRS